MGNRLPGEPDDVHVSGAQFGSPQQLMHGVNMAVGKPPNIRWFRQVPRRQTLERIPVRLRERRPKRHSVSAVRLNEGRVYPVERSTAHQPDRGLHRHVCPDLNASMVLSPVLDAAPATVAS